MTEEQEARDNARARALLSRMPGPDVGSVARVRNRLRRAAPARPVAVAFSAAALGALAASLAWFVVPLVRPASSPEAEPAVAESPLGLELEASGVLRPAKGLALRMDGRGTVGGTTRRPEIQLDSGSVVVEVEPDAGLDVAVRTREAEVRVVGTGFTVARDVYGTAVKVRHGRVIVRCDDRDTAEVTDGGSRLCLPRSAGGMLGRARALEDAAAPASEVLAAAERGLAFGDGPAPLLDELESTRIRALYAAGRRVEAIEAGERYLARPDGLRRDEVARLVAAGAQ
jgi:ferric-dicitrate binding protein FerR (iron transport regulator)